MNQEDKLKKLASVLLERTLQGRVQWKPWVRSNSFIFVPGATSTVIIEEKFAGNLPDPDYFIRILNADGEEVEAVSDEELDADEPRRPGPNKWFSLLRELYGAARRNSLGSDKIVEDLLRDLDGE